MKIYIAFQNVPHEFGSILGVFSTYALAFQCLKKYIANDKIEFKFHNWGKYSEEDKIRMNRSNIAFTDGNADLEIHEMEIDKEL